MPTHDRCDRAAVAIVAGRGAGRRLGGLRPRLRRGRPPLPSTASGMPAFAFLPPAMASMRSRGSVRSIALLAGRASMEAAAAPTASHWRAAGASYRATGGLACGTCGRWRAGCAWRVGGAVPWDWRVALPRPRPAGRAASWQGDAAAGTAPFLPCRATVTRGRARGRGRKRSRGQPATGCCDAGDPRGSPKLNQTPGSDRREYHA